MNQTYHLAGAALLMSATVAIGNSHYNFATRVLDYTPGADIATDFQTGAPFDVTETILGAPSDENPGDFGGPITPFEPPYTRDQLLSIGAGGSVTLKFEPPIFDHPAAPFGVDFILFGASGFTITNGDFSGGGITDGALFGAFEGESIISVSADGETFYRLDPSIAPPVDQLFPADASGNPRIPVDPDLSAADIESAGLDELRNLYSGSAGGAGYDLQWARASDGAPVALESVSFVRIEILSGRAELDAASVTQPTPKATSRITDLHETFDADPFESGWSQFGASELFSWNPEAKELNVFWDSSQPNSYFYLPLGAELTPNSDFDIEFEFTLESIDIGTTVNQPSTFPIAFGAHNFEQATRPEFYRGTGVHAESGPRSVVEWAYFPDDGFGATVSSGFISDANQWAFQNSFPLELPIGKPIRTLLSYSSHSQTLTTEMWIDGAPFGPIKDAQWDSDLGSFALDTLAISSYTDAGQPNPEFAGSIQSRARFSSVRFHSDAAPRITAIREAEGHFTIEFNADAGHRYWLERAHAVDSWRAVAILESETTETRAIQDPIPLGRGEAFYRIRRE